MTSEPAAPDDDPQTVVHRSDDDEVSLLVGQIIRGWSGIENEVCQQIRQMQTHFRVRRLRARMAEWQEHRRELTFRHPLKLETPVKKFELRRRYWRKLYCTLWDHDPKAVSNVAKLITAFDEMIDLRNALAHGVISMTPRAEGQDAINIKKWEWTESYLVDRALLPEQRKGVPETRRFTLDELREAVVSLQKLSSDVDQLTFSLPDPNGPEIDIPPAPLK
ncbi:hypothetical protein [Tardiphaga sp.]|uniref:hypothetical protein n=1 Tax=Tardiphaga sp. TaxID=1926292 RepID=UPI002608F9E9|nr:hypothetical protein [Tardiphaga sp.]